MMAAIVPESLTPLTLAHSRNLSALSLFPPLPESQCRRHFKRPPDPRRRVASEGLMSSSFYGESGRLNYVNTMFDLFLVFKVTERSIKRRGCLAKVQIQANSRNQRSAR